MASINTNLLPLSIMEHNIISSSTTAAQQHNSISSSTLCSRGRGRGRGGKRWSSPTTGVEEEVDDDGRGGGGGGGGGSSSLMRRRTLLLHAAAPPPPHRSDMWCWWRGRVERGGMRASQRKAAARVTATAALTMEGGDAR
jgi:hypothetical protein